MTASPVTTLLVRTGTWETVAATYEAYRVKAPDVYGSVARLGVVYRWWISATPRGRRLSEGRAISWNGAWGRAIRAAHRPGGWRGAR